MTSRRLLGRARPDFLLGAALGLGCWLLFVANGRIIATEDSWGTALSPFAIWAGQGLRLDAFVPAEGETGSYAIVRDLEGHARNTYPPGAALIAAPLYLPLVWSEGLDPREPAVLPIARIAEKHAAATLSAAAVVLLFTLLRRSTGRAQAALWAAVFGLATPVWSVASQALWQHGPGALALLVALRGLLVDRPTTGLSALSGLATALLVAVRPPNALLAAGVAAVAMRRDGRRVAAPFLLVAAAGIAALARYNWAHHGSLVGGYTAFRIEFVRPGQHLLGALLSNRGWLVYCPFLLWLLWPARLPRGIDREDALCLSGGVGALVLFYASFKTYWGGENFGNRFFIEAMPILILLGAGSLDGPQRALRRWALRGALGVAIGIQAVGVFWFPSGDSARLANREPLFWSLRRSVPALALGAGLPPVQLHPLVRLGNHRAASAEASASIELAVAPPRQWMPRGWHPVELRVENRGRGVLPAHGSFGAVGAVRLQVIWRAVEGPAWEASEFGLGGDLAPGEWRQVALTLVAPETRGRYQVEIQVVQRTDELPRSLAGITPMRVAVPPAGLLFWSDFEDGGVREWSAHGEGESSPGAPEEDR